MDSAPDGPRTLRSFWLNSDDNRYVVVLNEDAAKRNLNLNAWNDEWNSNYLFAAVATGSCPTTWWGFSCPNLPLPAAKLTPDLIEQLSNAGESFRVECFGFPGKH